MKAPPEAVRESMERARNARWSCKWHHEPSVWGAILHGQAVKRFMAARRETREILRALRTLRRQEEAGILGLGGKGTR